MTSQTPLLAPEDDLRLPLLLLSIASATLFALLPVMVASHLPLLDAPGHESRLAVLHDLLINNREWKFYRLRSLLVPDIIFDIIGSALLPFVQPETAGRVFFALTQVLTLWGVIALNRVAIQRWNLGPLLAALVLFNLVSVLGFLSYAFGLALVPWALAARLKLGRVSVFASFCAGACMAVALLFCHVFAFGIYSIMSAGFALSALSRKQTTLPRAVLWMLEQAPAAILYLSMAVGGASPRYDPHFALGKLASIVKAFTCGSMAGDLAFAAGAIALLVFLVSASRPKIAPSFIPGLLLLGVLYIVLPQKLGSGAYVDSRMPIAIILLTFAGLDVQMTRARFSAVLIAIIVAAFVAKQIALTVLWRSMDTPIDTISASLNELPRGAVIFQAECQPDAGAIESVYHERQPSMSHLAAMAAFTDERFVANSWAIAGQQPIQVSDAYAPYYNVQNGFSTSSCGQASYTRDYFHIRDAISAQQLIGKPIPPIYFLLIRQPGTVALPSPTARVASGPGYEIYSLR